jgi:hypothetical protein
MDLHGQGWQLLLPVTHHNKQNTHHEPEEYQSKTNCCHSKIDSGCPILLIVLYMQTWGVRRQNVGQIH